MENPLQTKSTTENLDGRPAENPFAGPLRGNDKAIPTFDQNVPESFKEIVGFVIDCLGATFPSTHRNIRIGITNSERLHGCVEVDRTSRQVYLKINPATVPEEDASQDEKHAFNVYKIVHEMYHAKHGLLELSRNQALTSNDDQHRGLFTPPDINNNEYYKMAVAVYRKLPEAAQKPFLEYYSTELADRIGELAKESEEDAATEFLDAIYKAHQ